MCEKAFERAHVVYAKKAAYLTSIDSMVGALFSLPCGKCDGNRELWWCMLRSHNLWSNFKRMESKADI